MFHWLEGQRWVLCGDRDWERDGKKNERENERRGRKGTLRRERKRLR